MLFGFQQGEKGSLGLKGSEGNRGPRVCKCAKWPFFSMIKISYIERLTLRRTVHSKSSKYVAINRLLGNLK